jgi:hypothetical protein
MYWGLRARQVFTDRSSKAVLIVRYRSLRKTACFISFFFFLVTDETVAAIVDIAFLLQPPPC